MQDVHMRTTLSAGTIVQGRYSVEELLGKGGFGAVYLVRDRRVRGNVFALKETVDPNKKERDRFTFEGEVLKRLDHPSLPRVYRTFDDSKNYRAYILMDYIAGSNLEALRQKQPEKRFSTAQAMRMMEPVINAIEYLHQQQPPIVHRDIKPANIIIPDEGDSAVLVDFGIAKEYDMDATTTAIRRCSPGYGAPEQYASGTNPRTDIYGLGATFYTLLTGKVPMDAVFRMTQLGSKSIDPLEPVSDFVSDVPPHVVNAIQRALSIRSEDRFADVREFWQALNAYPIKNDQPGAVVVLPAPEKRHIAEPVTPPIDEVATQVLIKRQAGQRRGAFALLSLLILLLLIAGIIFGTHLLPFAASGHTTYVPSRATARPATITVRSTPTVQATPTPTATAVATTAPAPASSYPKLTGGYNGSISDQQTSPATNSSMTLSQIQQNGASIQGRLALGAGLLASDTFSGSVGTNQSIQFVVPAYSYLAPLLFQGQLQANGSISGTYCSYRGNQQCDHNAGGWGTWNVSPA